MISYEERQELESIRSDLDVLAARMPFGSPVAAAVRRAVDASRLGNHGALVRAYREAEQALREFGVGRVDE